MNKLVSKLDFQIDLIELQETVLEFLDRYHWDETNQLCLLNTIDHEAGDPYQGTGHIKNPNSNSFGHSESDFKVFHPDFENTILGKIYKSFPSPICRMRLMRVPAKSCYTFHTDGKTHRYHFAVISNDNAFFVFKELGKISVIPVDGHAYKVNVEKVHTFVNTNSDFDRIHLVLDAAPISSQ